jgi:hypothetical protein
MLRLIYLASPFPTFQLSKGTLQLCDGDSTFFADFLTRVTTKAIIGIAGIHGVLLAILFYNRYRFARASVYAVTTRLAFLNVNSHDVHGLPPM